MYMKARKKDMWEGEWKPDITPSRFIVSKYVV